MNWSATALISNVSATTILWILVAAGCGYLVGAINPAALIARARGIDLAGSGSGNPGATNAARIMGRKIGIIVLVLDLLKGVVPVLVFRYLADLGIAEVAGFAAVLGHITSPFLRGRGGKGVATTIGVLLAVYPLWLIPVMIASGIVFLWLRRTGMASVAGAIVLVITALLDRHDLGLSVFGVLLGVLIIIRHQSNIRAAVASIRAGKS